MTDFKELSDYADAFMYPENDLLKQMEEQAARVYIPIMHKSAMAFVQQLIKWKKANRILELGTAIGYSAIRMALAAGTDAKIITVERDEQMVREAESNIRHLSLDDSIKVVLGDASEDLPEVIQSAPYDLILIDAAKAQYERLFPKYARLLAASGTIVTDNILFHGLVCDIDGVKKRQLHRLVEKVDQFNHFLSRQENYETVYLTVGDGLAVSTKKPLA